MHVDCVHTGVRGFVGDAERVVCEYARNYGIIEFRGLHATRLTHG